MLKPILLLAATAAVHADTILVEAESFKSPGGWSLIATCQGCDHP